MGNGFPYLGQDDGLFPKPVIDLPRMNSNRTTDCFHKMRMA